jgi:hypothetical protein
MSEWDYEASKPMAGGAYRIRARAEKDGTVSQLVLDTFCFEQNDVIAIHHHDGGVLLQYAKGPKNGRPEIKAVAIFEMRPHWRPFWLNLESLKKIIEKQGFLTAWKFIKEDLEGMLVRSFRL